MLKTLTIISTVIIFLVIAIMTGTWWLANSMADKIVPVVNQPIASSSPIIATATIMELTIASSTTSTIPVEVKPVADIASSSLKAEEIILIPGVPFTMQAPSGEWSDPMQQDGCEEAATLMAVYWAKDLKLDKATAKKEIVAMGNYQQKNYGEYRDTDVFDTVERLFVGYWKFTNAQIDARLSKAKVIKALTDGKLVIVPTNGKLLKNPNFKAPGPITHMIVIKGFDPATDEFITNDPGTRKGESYRYSSVVLLNAVVTYPTGYHGVQDITKKSMIIVSR